MAWSEAQQKLARAVYAAAKVESRHAPMDYVVSTGNVLMRTFERGYLPPSPGLPLLASKVNENALTVRDAGDDRNRFSGIIPAYGSGPQIQDVRGGGLYCAKDLRSQMAEMLTYSKGHESRSPGSLPFPLQAMSHRWMVLIKPRNDLSLVTLDGGGANVDHFYDRLQRTPAVRAAMTALGYSDITQAIFSRTDYSAARGLGLGLVANPGIDGIEIGSARSFETVTDTLPMSIFKSGTNVMLFGKSMEVLSHRLRVIALMAVEPDANGGWRVLRYEPNVHGDFVEKSNTQL